MAKKAKTITKKTARPVKTARTSTAPKKQVAPVPAGYHTVTPYLICRGAADAMAFYRKAFGAKERMRMDGPDGSIAHAEMQIGGSMIMLGDENPRMGAQSPLSIGGTAVHIFLYLPNVDKAFAQAVAAGAKAEMPPTDMFWGDRYAKLADPYGHKWSMATHMEDVSPKEMARRGAEAMKSMG